MNWDLWNARLGTPPRPARPRRRCVYCGHRVRQSRAAAQRFTRADAPTCSLHADLIALDPFYTYAAAALTT